MNQSPEQLPFFLGSRLVKELDLGVGGNLYGGRMLDFTAEQAAIHAAGVPGNPSGRLPVLRILPDAAGQGGEILDFYAGKPEFGRSSVTFAIEVRVGGERALRGECTFVAIGPDGRKKALKERKP